MNSFISKEELIACGYPKHTAQNIIRQAKDIMVQKGYPFYMNKRLGRVPKDVVESILGSELDMEEKQHG
ncbi:DUF3173 domain-containing protein [Enterococcus sp. MJM12]|uniref:DUF3173 domain-containing protein n=1 Tax=Candidatus Enterococcus myersii TaxID=2815322 RepID=A0ABS3H6T2_9ENTE|nr:DUF3173 domain-containing protein [Enterococcus sp. MJM12]MBO0449170.1 DUF3173 domain-containing protein [Enterococcus sp. MJM12]